MRGVFVFIALLIIKLDHEIQRWGKERGTSYRLSKVHQVIMVSFSVTENHTVKHLFKMVRCLTGGNKHQTLLFYRTIGHALTQDLHRLTIVILEIYPLDMCRQRFVFRGVLYVVLLGAAYDVFLLFLRQSVPLTQIMDIFLYMNVATAAKCIVFITYQATA